MTMRKVLVAAGVALLGSLAACSHSKAMKTTPNGPNLAQMPEEKQARTPEQKPAETPPARAQGPEDSAVFFDYNSYLLRSDARAPLQRVASRLKKDRETELRIEGNCDERGTEEFNLALGDHRARAAKRYLHDLGVLSSRIKTVSYGKDHPKETGHDEGAWAKNRRDDLVVK
jgi:peptidoglycan-associated lipoprotein